MIFAVPVAAAAAWQADGGGLVSAPTENSPTGNPKFMGGSTAIIVAAGRGQRFGGDVPKQYRLLAGKPVLRHVVERFLQHPDIDAVRVVIHPDDRALYDKSVAGLTMLAPVYGGASRQDSVLNGLESVAASAPDKVLIHDAARPFIDVDTISRTLDALDRHVAALVAVPVVDTLKRAGTDDTVETTIARDGLWRAQTPQGFRYPDILAAHRAARGLGLTDDASVAEHAGMKIALVPGNEDNFKITTEADLTRADKMLGKTFHTRAATGFDVHAFGPGDHVWLCGVQVPHEQGLVGHSDADVALHALTDALLGCIGAGDIGSHFSDQDARWRGAASHIFLKHAADLVAEKGGRIVHVDATIICERPKVRPHHAKMVARIAEILGVAEDRVSVKATTTEKLGFTGRREGIACQAIATVALPGDP